MKIGEQSHFALGSVNGPSGNDGLATGFAWAVDNAALVDLLPDGTDPAKVIVRSKSTPGTATLTLSAKNSAGATISGTHSVTVDKPAPPAATSLTVAEGITEPIPPAPPPATGNLIPQFRIDQNNINWQQYVQWVGNAVTDNNGQNLEIKDVAPFWLTVGAGWSGTYYPFGAGHPSTDPNNPDKTFTSDDIRDWCIAKFRSLLAAALTKWNNHQNLTEFSGDAYLYWGDTLRDWLYVLNRMRDRLTAQEIADAEMICRQAVWNVWNSTQSNWNGALFAWSGWSISDPLNNYFSRGHLPGTERWAFHSQEQQWLDKVTVDLIPLVRQKIADSFAVVGLAEGTAYSRDPQWAQDIWLTKTLFNVDLTADADLDQIVDFWVNATTPDYKSFPPIGDTNVPELASAVTKANLISIMSFGILLGIPQATADRARYWMTKVGRDVRPGDFWHCCLANSGTESPLAAKSHFAPGVGILFGRTDEVLVSFKAGPFLQGHDHKNQGDLQLYLVPASGQAADGWLMPNASAITASGTQWSVEFHNTIIFKNAAGAILQPDDFPDQTPPTIQHTDDGNVLSVTVDLKPAYSSQPDVLTCSRAWTLDRAAKRIVVTDSFTTQNGATGGNCFTFKPQPVDVGAGSWSIGPLTVKPSVAPIVTNWRTKHPEIAFSGDYFAFEQTGANLTTVLSW